MDADSAEDASLPPLQIHLSSSIPGSSVPIRAPLTIDSDSDFCLSINDHIYYRTSSFNSCSSIDISSYGDEHTSVLEEEDNTFIAYPDEEIVVEGTHGEKSSFLRPSMKYPEGNYVNGSSYFKESTIFRPSVNTLYEDSSANTGIKLGVPIAPLTSDCDSDTDIDSDYGRRWFDSGRIPADRNVQKVSMAPKVRIFDGDEGDDEVDDELQVEGVFSSGDDIIGIEELHSASDELIEDEGCKVGCLNEVVKLSGSDELSFELERVDAQIVSSSNNEIETETINVKLSESDKLSFDLERIDAQVVSSLNGEIEIDTVNVKHSESDELRSDLERTDAHIVSYSDNRTEVKTTNESEQEAVFDSSRNESKETLSRKEDKISLEMKPIRTKFLRLVLRKQLTTEVNGEGDKFDFHLTILAIGKTGVGKSATINSIFGQNKAFTDAFNPGTATIQEINGNVDGIQLSVIDTPGLKCSSFDLSYNLRILKAIKRFTRKHTPDVVLYVDRLDTHTRNNNDLQHLRLITSSLGSSVWSKCVIALTHATSNPPDELSREFVNQRRRFIQEQIVRNGGSNQYMANPVWLVENHPCYKYDSIDLEEDGCNQVPSFEPSRESQDIVNHSLVHKSLFQRVHLSLKLFGNRNWCRVIF